MEIEECFKPTTMTYKNGYTEISITAGRSDLTMEQVRDYFIKPLLLAAGYHPDTIKEYFD